MTYDEILSEIKRKKSFLCVGLDPDLQKIPKHLLSTKDPIFEFNKAIIEASSEYCVAFKPNIAFYESLGPAGWETLEKTLEIIPKNIFTIADAKRGDIGNTSKLYAKTFFERMDFDAITVAPYMGEDSIKPFFEYKNKWVIILGLTSNPGSRDFQMQIADDGRYFHEHVIETAAKWGNKYNTMFVTGATQSSYIEQIRDIIPQHFLLVPGVGAQGGSLEEVVKHGKNEDIGLLINSSRGIIYASSGEDFAEKAGQAASELQKEMAVFF